MKNSIQLFNIQLDLSKNLLVSLTKVFGINLFFSHKICTNFGFNKNSSLEDVSLEVINEMRKFILNEYLIQDRLHKNTQSSILDLITLKSVKGLRHKLKLPIRGQRTRTNHKTQKKL